MQKTAYEMRISDWSSDVCSSDLLGFAAHLLHEVQQAQAQRLEVPAAVAERRLRHQLGRPGAGEGLVEHPFGGGLRRFAVRQGAAVRRIQGAPAGDRKSTRLNSSH